MKKFIGITVMVALLLGASGCRVASVQRGGSIGEGDSAKVETQIAPPVGINVFLPLAEKPQDVEVPNPSLGDINYDDSEDDSPPLFVDENEVELHIAGPGGLPEGWGFGPGERNPVTGKIEKPWPGVVIIWVAPPSD